MTEESANFACMNEDDPTAAMVMRHNREMVACMLEMQVVPEEDLRAYCARKRASLGISTHAVKQMLNVSVMLRRMPKLAQLAADGGHLDLGRLSSIENQVSGVSDEHIAQVEDLLIDRLTPKVRDQDLPQRRTLANYARTIVGSVDPEAVVAKRDHKTPKVSMRVTDHGQYQLSATLDPLNGAKVYSALHKRAGKKVTPETLYKALVELIDQQLITRIRLHAFADPSMADAVYLLGAGYLFGDDAKAVMEAVTSEDVLSAEGAKKTQDKYQIPESLRSFIMARDGSCRFPGCSVTARNCQIDHVVPFSQGGKTVDSNLQCLCPPHHTLKTEKLVQVVMDAVGVCEWTLNDGTLLRTLPNGPLSHAPARSEAAQAASVRGHTIQHDIKRRRARGSRLSPGMTREVPRLQPERSTDGKPSSLRE